MVKIMTSNMDRALKLKEISLKVSLSLGSLVKMPVPPLRVVIDSKLSKSRSKYSLLYWEERSAKSAIIRPKVNFSQSK